MLEAVVASLENYAMRGVQVANPSLKGNTIRTSRLLFSKPSAKCLSSIDRSPFSFFAQVRLCMCGDVCMDTAIADFATSPFINGRHSAAHAAQRAQGGTWQ